MMCKLPVSVYILIATVLGTLAFVNWDIYQKEQQLAKGKVVRLTLAPVDPRSLMQGDYMALNYAIAAELRARIAMEVGDGLLQVKLDENQVAQLVSVDNGSEAKKLSSSDIINIQYRVRHKQIKFASNAYFFEEGQAKRYEAAKYGQFRVNQQGALLLESMLDKDFKPL
ncbi:GDYXXLXY domain-containing protein [uncultured Shewanella sp.]|uniref:GDYXXLXY domain-containing protein n=1 Tax=uncultured Shewanella sp. TaxID=173975 RepID=UPI00261C6B54|nr:GDYXXLXY domain-containing protein [uncultured Shewanella sp.]